MRINSADRHGYDHEHHPQHVLDRREMLIQSGKVFGAAALATLLGGHNHASESSKTPMDPEHDDLLRLIDESWEAQNDRYGKIAESGFQRFYESLPDRERAFFTPAEIEAGHGKCECCSDEGNRHYRAKGSEHDMMLVRTPGSGVLQALDTEHQDPFDAEFIETTARDALAAGVTVFTSHTGCGAFKAVYNSWLTKNGKPAATPAELDALSARWSKAVAARMRELAPDKPDIKDDFIAKLDRPKDIHIARCLYLTDLDELNAGYEGLPQGFVERTGRVDNLSDVLEHADVLRQIAFDKEHAFGAKFSDKPAEQFVLCCVTDDPARMDILTTKAKAALAALDGDIQKKIRVEGILRA